MNPVSQIELNTHLKDLERQVATARQSQGAALDWLKMLWRSRRSKGAKNSKTLTPLHPGSVSANGL